jgi:hypothetical protein
MADALMMQEAPIMIGAALLLLLWGLDGRLGAGHRI